MEGTEGIRAGIHRSRVILLVRHYVELTFKQLIHESGAAVPGTHDLSSLWGAARKAPGIADNEHADATVLDAITAFISVLVDLDPTSFTFRYPVDTRGEARGLAGSYSAKRCLEWARALHDAFAALEGAIEMNIVERQLEAEMWREFGP